MIRAAVRRLAARDPATVPPRRTLPIKGKSSETREGVMQRTVITTATTAMLFGAMLLAAGLVSSVARAEQHYGPTHNGSRCFTASPGFKNDGFGYWGSCPSTATQEVPAQVPNGAASQPASARGGNAASAQAASQAATTARIPRGSRASTRR